MTASSFPLTAKYHAQWIPDNALGENALCQMERLARHLSFQPGGAIGVVEWAEILPESDKLLRIDVDGKRPAQDVDSIMRAVSLDRHGLIALFCPGGCRS